MARKKKWIKVGEYTHHGMNIVIDLFYDPNENNHVATVGEKEFRDAYLRNVRNEVEAEVKKPVSAWKPIIVVKRPCKPSGVENTIVVSYTVESLYITKRNDGKYAYTNWDTPAEMRLQRCWDFHTLNNAIRAANQDFHDGLTFRQYDALTYFYEYGTARWHLLMLQMNELKALCDTLNRLVSPEIVLNTPAVVQEAGHDV